MTDKNAYYTKRREDLIARVPDEARRILEVGCGTGETAGRIKELRGGHIEVAGIELDRDAGEKAKAKLDRVIVGNAEAIELPFEKGYFDCIIYGDVLEHLVDPWGTLTKHCVFLKKGGRVIASIPNIAHYRIVKMLRKKEWTYQDAGLLDRKHLRFFTRKSIREMCEGAGLEIMEMAPVIGASKAKRFLNTIFFNALIDDITEQYLVVARK